jgi:hypothetical protein
MGILSTPVRGLFRVFEEIAHQAEDELYNEDALKAQLVELHRRFEAGGIKEEDFDREEVALIKRIQEASKHKRRGAHAKRAS